MNNPLWWYNPILNRPNNNHQTNLAILIDTENTSPFKIVEVFNDISTIGKSNIRRAYGDWTNLNMGSWKKILNRYAIQPVQQFTYSKGKNATDSALIIDAMDLIYTTKLDGFCIISSDSDYTRLAVRIKESGYTVYGYGEKKTPEAFIKSCDKFTYLENLAQSIDYERMRELTQDEKLMTTVKSAVDAAYDETGWSEISRIGQIIRNRESDFDYQEYGFKTLTDMIRAMGIFSIEERRIPNSTQTIVYVRLPELFKDKK